MIMAIILGIILVSIMLVGVIASEIISFFIAKNDDKRYFEQQMKDDKRRIERHAQRIRAQKERVRILETINY
jgi:biopolymer transport protein ExbB/TolQ